MSCSIVWNHVFHLSRGLESDRRALSEDRCDRRVPMQVAFPSDGADLTCGEASGEWGGVAAAHE